MRLSLIAAAAACALFATPALAQSQTFTDEDLTAYTAAMAVIMPISEASAGAPSPEQQAQMAQAVTDAGLTVDQFNAIATATQGDAVLRARIDLLATPAPAEGALSTTVSDEEVRQFAQAMVGVRAATAGSTSLTPEQQAAMAAAVTEAGLTPDRFNTIGGGMSGDAHLRARIALAEAEIAA